MGNILASPVHETVSPVDIPRPRSVANKLLVPSVVGKCSSINPKVPYKVASFLPEGMARLDLNEISK